MRKSNEERRQEYADRRARRGVSDVTYRRWRNRAHGIGWNSIDFDFLWQYDADSLKLAIRYCEGDARLTPTQIDVGKKFIAGL